MPGPLQHPDNVPAEAEELPHHGGGGQGLRAGVEPGQGSNSDAGRTLVLKVRDHPAGGFIICRSE